MTVNDTTMAETSETATDPEPITYTPTVWQQGEDGGTPINAANLNNMEEAIVALVERTTKQIVTSMIADGAVTNAKLDQTLRDSLSRAAYHAKTSTNVSDLDNHLEGVVVYNPETKNIPVANSYGVCVCFASHSESDETVSRWATQLALPTTGYPMWRRKVNLGNWTQWLYMAQ